MIPDQEDFLQLAVSIIHAAIFADCHSRHSYH